MAFRKETDSMGEMEVPIEALYGASTQRAVLNFPVSGRGFGRPMIRAMGLVKWASAEANFQLGTLDSERYEIIVKAAEEVFLGLLDSHFVVDVFQTGSGTSTNMNANEVIANRAAQLAGREVGAKDPHPNDHVNLGQSSNDTFPTAIHLAVAETLQGQLIPELEALNLAFAKKGAQFWGVLKIGRTHLMDATPVRLGQVFAGYARQLEKGANRAQKASKALHELPLGGTAVGTGINTHPEFAKLAIEFIAKKTGIPFTEASNHFEAQSSKDGFSEASGQLKTVATALFKIANDLRFLSSGPRCGLGEIQLPATQPGSSIMPGKVNPVICESVMQVSAQVIGNDAAITWGAANGNLELNVMMPMMARNLLESIELLANVARLFRERCVVGITANPERCQELIEWSLSMVTSLVPLIGYDLAADIAKEAVASGKTVRQVCTEREVLPPEQLAQALDPVQMTEPSA